MEQEKERSRCRGLQVKIFRHPPVAENVCFLNYAKDIYNI